MELDDRRRAEMCSRRQDGEFGDRDRDADGGDEECSTSGGGAGALIRNCNSNNSKWEKVMPLVKNNGKSNSIRVLLVEGDDSTRHIISALLRKCSYSVAAVPDGFKAWELLKERPQTIDVVLAEVDVPSISGVSLLSMITDHDACSHIPVIMMSSNDSINMVFNCMLKGAADFLVKPVRKNELSILWQHVWRRHASSDGRVGTKVHQHVDDMSNRFAPPVRMNKECSERASDAASSYPKSDMEAESAYKQNSLEPDQHATCKGLSHNNDATCAEGEIQPNLPLMDHTSKDEAGESIMWGSECTPVIGTCIANEQLLEEECSWAQVETANDMGEQTYDEVSHPRQIIDFIGAIDNKRQFGQAIQENTDMDNNVHGAPEVIFRGEDSSCKSSYAPFLELSLRRHTYGGVDNEEKAEHVTLNHSYSSAFSIYSRTPVSPLATTVNLQAGGEEYHCPRNGRTCNGTAQHINVEEAESESASFGVSNPNGIAIRCSPIRAIPMSAPVGGMKFDQSAGFHRPMNSSPSEGHEPIPTSASHQSEANASDTFHQHPRNQQPESPILYSAQIEHRNGNTETIDNEGSGNIGTTNIPHGTPEFRNQEDKKPADMHRLSQREAALNKFRLKRKERCFEKKVRYQSRKRLAEQRPRVKGQFVRHIQPDAMDCQVEQAVG